MAKVPETLGEKITYVEGRWQKVCADQLPYYQRLATLLGEAFREISQSGEAPNLPVMLSLSMDDFLLVTKAVSLVTAEAMLRNEGGRSMYQRN